MMIEEQAKEELRILESQYPNSYEYLKLELKSFIFLLQSHHHTDSSAAATQESTSNRKRKKIMSESHCIEENDKQEFQKNQSSENVVIGTDDTYNNSRKLGKRRDRVELVLERAHACLRKIRHLKTSLLS